MDRLIAAIDGLLASHDLDEEVVVTAAAYRRRPVLARGLGIQPYDVLNEMARSATAIVTHGGPASVALALQAGHSPVVVPRDPAFQEHVDDHQVRFGRWLEEHRGLTVVRDVGELGDALRTARSGHAGGPRVVPVPTEAVGRLRSIIERDQ